MYIINSYKKNNNIKYGIILDDKALIEIAIFEHHKAIHFCVPSQVGCNMGCKHCSTSYALSPYIRNLTYMELKDMIELIIKQSHEFNKNSHWILSFSGHGEPMLNWNSIQKCINCYHETFSNIYVTSIGFVDTMKRILSESKFHPNIYFSIHGSNDEERSKLIPSVKLNNFANLQQIIKFGELYTQQGGKVIWNYMLCNINSSENSLKQLIALCKHVDYPLELRFTKYIDINRDNDVKEVNNDIVHNFYEQLSDQLCSNINIRLSTLEGEDIGIACGQMRAQLQQKYKNDQVR